MNWQTRALASVYLALLPIGWPVLPGNLRGIDLVFPVLAFLVLTRTGWCRPRLTAIDYVIVAYLLAAIPSLWATDDLARSGLGLMKNGYLALVYVVFALYFRREGVATAARIIVLAAVLMSLAGLSAVALYYATGAEIPAMGVSWALPYVGRVLRLWVGTDSSEMFGNYLTFVLPLLFGIGFAAPRVSLRTWSALGVITGAVALTFSHAVAGFAVAMVSAMWRWLKARAWPIARIAVVSLAITLVVVMNLMLLVTVRKVGWVWDWDISVSPPEYHYAMQTDQGADRLTLQLSYNPMSYFLIKRIAIRAFLDHPWTGVGVGRFHTVTERAYQEGRIHRPYRAIDPHSTILGALAEKGILGGLTVLVLLITAAVTPRRSRAGSTESWAVPALHAAIIGLIVNSINADIMNFRFLWIGLAALRASA